MSIEYFATKYILFSPATKRQNRLQTIAVELSPCGRRVSYIYPISLHLIQTTQVAEESAIFCHISAPHTKQLKTQQTTTTTILGQKKINQKKTTTTTSKNLNDNYIRSAFYSPTNISLLYVTHRGKWNDRHAYETKYATEGCRTPILLL